MQANAQTYSRQQLTALGLSLSVQAMTFVALYVPTSYLQCVVVALVDKLAYSAHVPVTTRQTVRLALTSYRSSPATGR